MLSIVFQAHPEELIQALDFIPEPPLDPEKQKLLDEFDEETRDKIYPLGSGLWARMGTTQPYWPGVAAPDPDDPTGRSVSTTHKIKISFKFFD